MTRYNQRITPVGVNQPDDADRRPIWKAYNGDELRVRTRLENPWDSEPSTSANCEVEFVLADTRFSAKFDTLWEGAWGTGIEAVDAVEHPGLIDITIPAVVSGTLRRGSFIYSLTLTNPDTGNRYTVMEGSLLIEYAPTTPIQDIPYKE